MHTWWFTELSSDKVRCPSKVEVIRSSCRVAKYYPILQTHLMETMIQCFNLFFVTCSISSTTAAPFGQPRCDTVELVVRTWPSIRLVSIAEPEMPLRSIDELTCWVTTTRTYNLSTSFPSLNAAINPPMSRIRLSRFCCLSQINSKRRLNGRSQEHRVNLRLHDVK